MKKIWHWYHSNKGLFWKISLAVLLVLFLLPIITTKRVSIDKEYTSAQDVALYLKTFHELPSNFITKYGKDTAATHGGDITYRIIGGDTHWKTDELESFRVNASALLKECDIPTDTYDLSTNNRGTVRLVYTSNTKNVRVFYSEDHYVSFSEITTFGLQMTRNIFWIIFGVYSMAMISFAIIGNRNEKKSVPES